MVVVKFEDCVKEIKKKERKGGREKRKRKTRKRLEARDKLLEKARSNRDKKRRITCNSHATERNGGDKPPLCFLRLAPPVTQWCLNESVSLLKVGRAKNIRLSRD